MGKLLFISPCKLWLSKFLDNICFFQRENSRWMHPSWITDSFLSIEQFNWVSDLSQKYMKSWHTTSFEWKQVKTMHYDLSFQREYCS